MTLKLQDGTIRSNAWRNSSRLAPYQLTIESKAASLSRRFPGMSRSPTATRSSPVDDSEQTVSANCTIGTTADEIQTSV